MSERLTQEVLERAWHAAYDAFSGELLNDLETPNHAVAVAAMRAVLEGHLGKACTDNPLQNQLLDLITLMPDSQTQELVDYIMDLRRIRSQK